MKPITFVLASTIALLLSAMCLTSMASDWEDESGDWSDVSSEWEVQSTDWGDSDWSDSDWGDSGSDASGWGDQGWSGSNVDSGDRNEDFGDAATVGQAIQDQAVRLAAGQIEKIPQYPGSIVSDDASDEAEYYPTWRFDTGDSVVKVAGYYQWQLGVIPVEIRPYQFIIQIVDDETGLFTSVVMRPLSDDYSASGSYRAVEGMGTRIEVVESDTPHESLSAAVRRLGPSSDHAYCQRCTSDPMSEECDAEWSLEDDEEIDPDTLMSMMLMMMTMMGSENGEAGNMDQLLQMMGSGEVEGSFGGDSEFSGEFSVDAEGQFGAEFDLTDDLSDSSWDTWGSGEDW